MVEKPNNESLTLGVDLGGTKVETSLVDTTGHILASHRRPTYKKRGRMGLLEQPCRHVTGFSKLNQK